MEITGKYLLAKDIQKVSETFSKREVIVELEDGNYPQEIQLEFLQDRVDLIDSYNVGENLKFHINLRGKKVTKVGEPDRWYNQIVCWKIERA